MNWNWKKSAIATGVALGILGVAAYAHGPQSAYGSGGMGSGYAMMHGGGMGPGMMGGYGGRGGYGMGPGMMGPGMMGGYGMGPGMMGGHGMGPGMMGGDGVGHGMMGGYGGLFAIHRLDLTEPQRQQLREIEDALRKSNWNLMGRMQDEMVKARDAWSARDTDRNGILAANKRMFELRQQMLENRLDAQARAEALLTPQQREQYDKLASAWDDDE